MSSPGAFNLHLANENDELLLICRISKIVPSLLSPMWGNALTSDDPPALRAQRQAPVKPQINASSVTRIVDPTSSDPEGQLNCADQA